MMVRPCTIFHEPSALFEMRVGGSGMMLKDIYVLLLTLLK